MATKSDKNCGTRARYMSGCRCERCKAAQAAWMWADRKIRESWTDKLELSAHDAYNESFGVISGLDIIRAIQRTQHKIKVNVLTDIWCKLRGFKVDSTGCIIKQK